jgi:hypothetical protein
VGAAVSTEGTSEEAAHRNNLVERGAIFTGIGYHLCFEEYVMSITFPNESPACRSAREALYQRELEFRPSNAARRLRVTKAGSTSEDEGMSGIHRTWIDSWEKTKQSVLNGEFTEEQAAKLVYQRKFRNTLSKKRQRNKAHATLRRISAAFQPSMPKS